MNVVATWIGVTTPRVVGSSAPSICAARVRGFHLGMRSFMAVSNGARNGLLRTPYRVQEGMIRREQPVRSREEVSMAGFFYNLVPFAIGAVAVVLVLGLFNMMRGGSPNTSQKLMRLRVLLQFIAIMIVMTAIWLMGR